MDRPPPKAARTRPGVVLVLLWLCLLLCSLRVPWPLGGLPPARPCFAIAMHPPAVLRSDHISAAANAAVIPRTWLSGVCTPKSAHEFLLLSKPIRHSPAYTAVVWWECLDRSIRTASTAVFQFSRYLFGNLRAVFTTANPISPDPVNIKTRPPLPPIFMPPDADASVSPQKHSPRSPAVVPSNTDVDTRRLPIVDNSGHRKLHRGLSTQLASATTLPSKLGCPPVNLIPCLGDSSY